MGDAQYAQATNWREAVEIHRIWVRDYNVQRHWAHEKREDGCHSPAEVMGWHKGTMYPASVLDRILFATRYTRHLNQQGYLRFHDWKLYGERGLANEEVAVWVYEGTLKIEYRAVTLSRYTVELQEDRRHLKGVSRPRLAETPFRSPQLSLFDLGPDQWLLFLHLQPYARSHRKRLVKGLVQPQLLDVPVQEQAVGADQAAIRHPWLHPVPQVSEGSEEEE
jgi:hypothetical protein